MNFRKEKKYRLSISEMFIVKQKLLDNGIKKMYDSRLVSSCYFDTINKIFFNQSEEGVLPRKKIRIRWYNNKFDCNKEVKISSIEGRFKYTEKIKDILGLDDVYNKLFFDQDYGNLYPQLLVNYHREYFNLGPLRLTFDRNIYYKYPEKNSEKVFKDYECVLEVKSEFDCPDEYIEEKISLPTSRFSKYSRGISAILGV